MTLEGICEAFKEYAKMCNFGLLQLDKTSFEITFPHKTDRRLFFGCELTEGGSVYVDCKYLIGAIDDIAACVPLFFTGRWPTSCFFFRGQRIKGRDFLIAQTIIHLHEGLTIKQTAECLVRQAMLPFFNPEWPQGLDVFE